MVVKALMELEKIYTLDKAGRRTSYRLIPGAKLTGNVSPEVEINLSLQVLIE